MSVETEKMTRDACRFCVDAKTATYYAYFEILRRVRVPSDFTLDGVALSTEREEESVLFRCCGPWLG